MNPQRASGLGSAMVPVDQGASRRGVTWTSRYRGIALGVTALVVVGLSACVAQQSGTGEPTATARAAAAPASASAQEPTPAPLPSPLADATDVASVPGEFSALDPGRYYIRPVVPDGPTIYVLFTIPAPGWHAFIGGFKPGQDGRDQTVALHILNVTNLVQHGCTDHAMADPPVGDTVEDLANALAMLEPFEVAEPPSEVSRWGYDGMQLVLQVPDAPTTMAGGQLSFTGCVDGELKSWIGRPLSYAYYGYSPGLIERFWILDVDGQRLVIAADHHADAPPADMEQLQAVLDSIEIVVEAESDR